MILLAAVVVASGFSMLRAADANEPPAVQVDVGSLFNARVVTTFSDGKVVPFGANLDGWGGAITKSAVEALGSKNPFSLPDDGKFPANGDHPDVVLSYAKAGGSDNQVHRSGGEKEDEYSFAVPPGKYAKMFLFFNCGNGGRLIPLDVVLTYQDGSTEKRALSLPDWWWNIDEDAKAKDCIYWNADPNDKDCVYLASNLAKWGSNNKQMEWNHHNIYGLNVRPARDKVLTKITVHKTKAVVVFWGATGVPMER